MSKYLSHAELGTKVCELEEENAALKEQVAQLSTELETERMRLAACGVAALGYFDDCKDEYRSASLGDTLRLYENYTTLQSKSAALVDTVTALCSDIDSYVAAPAMIDYNTFWLDETKEALAAVKGE